MKHVSWWSVSIATLGSVIVSSTTLLHYLRAHESGASGGYLAIALGSVGVGVLASLRGYLSLTVPQRRLSSALAVAAIVGLLTFGILTATLIWAFGS
jgi:hypothetical protein